MRPPTDFAILKEIYERYGDEFARYVKTAPTRAAKAMVPIDIPAVAEHFDVDPDIIFGRLLSLSIALAALIVSIVMAIVS
ncbi:MAG TPA: hypothetical protein VNP89_03330 [Gaiellaceae bacterium]|nr:hypothetical protein [Gaiellaceae bacterium]